MMSKLLWVIPLLLAVKNEGRTLQYKSQRDSGAWRDIDLEISFPSFSTDYTYRLKPLSVSMYVIIDDDNTIQGIHHNKHTAETTVKQRGIGWRVVKLVEVEDET